MPSGDAVRTTFLEFWPDAFRKWALPHRVVRLSATEAGAIRHAHRFGGDPRQFIGLASRVCACATEPAFVRMGYGSWASTQLREFGTLQVCDSEQVTKVLALHERRLAEISRRWVRGFTPSLFVRPYLHVARQSEIRVLIEKRLPIRAWARHAPAEDRKLPFLPNEVLQSIPAEGEFTIDVVPQGLNISIIDFNPVVGSPNRG